ncbi:MAG: hypothetical protein JRI94_00045 [Deltaproteobacteria bacterium]|nr:hypothetical protein [Deltaproteobacteria bacterium]MBW2031972.1 hypothetical protein [Deltaproteobacteria bacterium]
MQQSNQEELSKESFGLWKTLPITNEILKGLREEKRLLQITLSTGQSLLGDAGATAEKTAELVGMIKGIDLVLNIEYEDGEGGTYGLSD